MARKSQRRPVGRPGRAGGGGKAVHDLLWRVDRLERQIMRLSELVRAHAEDEDRLVRIVAKDHEALRQELMARDGEMPTEPRLLRPVKAKVGLTR